MLYLHAGQTFLHSQQFSTVNPLVGFIHKATLELNSVFCVLLGRLVGGDVLCQDIGGNQATFCIREGY